MNNSWKSYNASMTHFQCSSDPFSLYCPGMHNHNPCYIWCCKLPVRCLAAYRKYSWGSSLTHREILVVQRANHVIPYWYALCTCSCTPEWTHTHTIQNCIRLIIQPFMVAKGISTKTNGNRNYFDYIYNNEALILN